MTPAENVGNARPTLLVVLPYLIEQQLEEIRELTDHFTIIKYHGDYRADSTNPIQLALTKEHDFFDVTDEANVARVMITTLKTPASRHGLMLQHTSAHSRAGLPRTLSYTTRRQSGNGKGYWQESFDTPWSMKRLS